MKGYRVRMEEGYVDMSPCGTCRNKRESTVGPHCYNCIDVVDLALHKPNAETEFANYEPFDNAEHCVCCGAVIPEGRQVCPMCEGDAHAKL